MLELVARANGSAPLDYQWFFNGAVIADATSPSLKVATVQPNASGAYNVRVANAFGSAVSETAVLTVVPVVPVGGRIEGTVVWAETNAAYSLNTGVLVPYGAELLIQPGVTVLGHGRKLWTAGHLSALGTPAAPIRFHELVFAPGAPEGDQSSSRPYRIEVQFATLDKGEFHGPTGRGPYGSFVLSDSTVSDIPYMYIWYPVADCYIERNVFRRFGGISVGHSDAIKVFVRNNVFYEPAPTYGWTYCVENWAAYDSSETVVQRNSFMFTNQVAVQMKPEYPGPNKMTAVSNFWSTTDTKVIESMINDRNDGTNFTGVIPYLPFLTDHHPGTPLPPPTITSGPLPQAVAAGDAVEFSVSASGEPLRYQWRHDGSDIPGGTNSILDIGSASPGDRGRYDVMVMNTFGEVRSSEATLSVSSPDGSPLIIINGVAGATFSLTNVEECAVNILTSLRNPSLFYTLDGSVPDFNGQLYFGPFPLRRSAVIRAAVYDSEFRRWESDPVQISLDLSPPKVLIGGQAAARFDYTNTTDVLVALGETMPNASIHYTLDGSAPSTNSILYSAPFVLSQSATVRAMAYTYDLGAVMAEPVSINLWQLHTLTVTTPGGGSVSTDPPGGIYRNDKVVNVIAQATPGWAFLRWEGDWESTNPGIGVPMDVPRTIRAIFGTSVTASGAGSGTVRLRPTKSAYPFGSIIECVAIPEPGNSFGLWGGSASGNVNPLLFTVTNPTPVISALFSPLPAGRHALTVIPNGRGSVTVTPRANSFADGETVSIQAIPEDDGRFLGWSGDAAGEANPISLTLHTSFAIMANFTGGEYSLQLSRIERHSDGSVTLTIVGEPGRTIALEASDDMRNWATLRFLPNQSGVTSALDLNATNWATRFYRASSP